jgi:hypothetical protein
MRGPHVDACFSLGVDPTAEDAGKRGLGGDEVDAGSEVAWFRVSILHLFDAPKERKA